MFVYRIGIITIPEKPVIYLYPTKITPNIKVKVDYKPGFSISYPQYNNGWEITAFPNGKIIDKDGKQYNYLYWEGNPNPISKYDLSTGFIVKGEDTVYFLQKKLKEIGLTQNEYNEFIVYWLPKMSHNSFNLIHFATSSEYGDQVKMDISPTPNSILRVFMVFKPLNKEISITPQSFKSFQRNGFTVVEWGGSELK